MILLFFLSIFLFLKYFCYGCLQNPQSCNRPLIDIGGMFECPPCPASPCSLSGPYVEIIPDPVVMTDDCCCIYTATMTCNPAPTNKLTQVMQFNGNAQSIAYPLSVACDTSTNRYVYDNAGTPTYINSAQCCLLTCVPLNVLSTQIDNIFVPDASCVYSRRFTCINGFTTISINMPPGAQTGAGFPGPETAASGALVGTCPAGATRYVWNSPTFGPGTTLGRLRCP